MTWERASVLCIAILLAAGPAAVCGQDWPEWCGQPSRNMAAKSDRKLPEWADCGADNDKGEVDLASTKNVKWAVELGHRTTGSPVVSQGRVVIGTTWRNGRDACFLCLDEQTGRQLGVFICPKPPREKLENWAISSTPTIEGDRLYFVSPYQEVVCIDLKVLLEVDSPNDGSDKAAIDRRSLKSIVWRYDLLGKLKAYYHHTASSSVLVHGDYVYVCTGNGRSWVPGRIPYSPLTPSLVVFDKRTGQLVARDDEQIGERLYRGQYGSPALGMVNGQAQILFATGDGFCYGFEPVDPSVKVAADQWTTTTMRGPITYFIDVEDKDTGGLLPAEYARSVDLLSTLPKPALSLEFRFSRNVPAMTPVDTIPTATVPDVPLLKKIWWCDCIPTEYKKNPFYPREIKGDGRGHPCDITGTPICWNDRVYVAIGGDPNHGGRDSKGSVVCIDATKTGDLTEKGVVWRYNGLNESVSTMAVADGLAYVVDAANTVHCLDANSGVCYWTHLTQKGGTCFSSPLVADGKLYLRKTILSAGKDFKLLGGVENREKTAYSSQCVANGVVFAVIGERLWALSDRGDRQPVKADASATAPRRVGGEEPSKTSEGGPVPPSSLGGITKNWPSFRGPFGQGIAYDAKPPSDFDVVTGKNVRWKSPVPRLGASSPVVCQGLVFLTSADKTAREIYCFDAANGKMLWRQTAKQPAKLPEVSEDYGHAASTGATDGQLFFAIFSTGNLVAVDMKGQVAWTRQLGPPKSSYGYASSLIVCKRLFVQMDDGERATLYALDSATGKTVWEKKRTVTQSWASPIIAVSGGREMVLLAENPTAGAYDVNTGEMIVSHKCLTGEVTPSPAYARGIMLVANDGADLSAISLASGTLAWSGEDDLPDVSSPLATEDFVFTASSAGVVTCYALDSGQKLWDHEFDESFYPSPVIADGRIYAMDNSGTLHVFRAAKTFELIADSNLGEESLATPAFVGDAMFIRGKENLYCIGANSTQ